MFTTKKLFAFSLIIAVFVVLPGCGSTNKTKNNNIGSEINDSGAVVGTIESLLGMNKSQKCTWKGLDGEKSVIYTDGKKSRVEISEISDEIDQTMLMINDGEWQYSWVKGEHDGTKINLKTLEEMSEQVENLDDENFEGEYLEEEFDVEEEGEYSCENWKVKQSYFVPSSDVNYVDMAEQMKEMENLLNNFQSPDLKDSKKALCDLVPSSEKEECLNSFK